MRLLKSAKEKTFLRRAPQIAVHDADVFIVSYPRSGNTWIRFLLANLLAPHETITFRNIENFVPDLHKSAAVLDNWPGHRYIKSHHRCYDRYPRFLYLYRDGRDAVVSCYSLCDREEGFFRRLGQTRVFTTGCQIRFLARTRGRCPGLRRVPSRARACPAIRADARANARVCRKSGIVCRNRLRWVKFGRRDCEEFV